MIESKPIRNPFPGLRPFETDEYRLFFGREGQADELIARAGLDFTGPTDDERNSGTAFVGGALCAAQGAVEFMAVVGRDVAIAFRRIAEVENPAVIAADDEQRVGREV